MVVYCVPPALRAALKEYLVCCVFKTLGVAFRVCDWLRASSIRDCVHSVCGLLLAHNIGGCVQSVWFAMCL